MNEAHFSSRSKRRLLYISEARVGRNALSRRLRKDGADEHLVEALEEADRELLALHRKLMQSTYFAVPKEQLTIS